MAEWAIQEKKKEGGGDGRWLSFDGFWLSFFPHIQLIAVDLPKIQRAERYSVQCSLRATATNKLTEELRKRNLKLVHIDEVLCIRILKRKLF